MAIYYLASPQDNLVKIGFSNFPRVRVSTIIADSPNPQGFTVLWVDYLALRAEEYRLHGVMSSERSHGEWFFWNKLYQCRCICGERLIPPELTVLSQQRPVSPAPDLAYGTLRAEYECPSCGRAATKILPLDYGPRQIERGLGLGLYRNPTSHTESWASLVKKANTRAEQGFVIGTREGPLWNL